jgi:hypothetical protein
MPIASTVISAMCRTVRSAPSRWCAWQTGMQVQTLLQVQITPPPPSSGGGEGFLVLWRFLALWGFLVVGCALGVSPDSEPPPEPAESDGSAVGDSVPGVVGVGFSLSESAHPLSSIAATEDAMPAPRKPRRPAVACQGVLVIGSISSGPVEPSALTC